MRVLGKDGYLPGVALFLELTDTQLEKVKGDRDYFFDEVFLGECLASKGEHAHIFGIYSDKDNRFKVIYKHYKMLLKDYKSVSWWDKERKEFKITRR